VIGSMGELLQAPCEGKGVGVHRAPKGSGAVVSLGGAAWATVIGVRAHGVGRRLRACARSRWWVGPTEQREGAGA
jgi:hypothetical protein